MLEYFKNIFLGVWTVLVGMWITFRHLFTRAVTIQYPDARIPMPERARNRIGVRMEDCIGCKQCAMACPVRCISIETIKAAPSDDLGTTSNGQKKRLWVTAFDIDFAKCCFCGLCVAPCPTECIRMTGDYEYSELNRSRLVYRFSRMTPQEIAEAGRRASAAAGSGTPPEQASRPPDGGPSA
jgi:NADH-quinone oxidoreductase subunit I